MENNKNRIISRNLDFIKPFIHNNDNKNIIQFKNLYINSNKKILIEYYLCNKIIAIIIFIEIKFNYNHVIFKTYDIENIYINGIKNYKILDYLIIDCKNNNIDMISCLNQSYNKYFIDKYNMKKE